MTSVSLRCAKAYISAVETFRGPDQRQIRFVCTFLEVPHIKVYNRFSVPWFLYTFRPAGAATAVGDVCSVGAVS